MLVLSCKCKVEFLSLDEIQQCSVVVNHQDCTISDIFGIIDGVSFISECTHEHVTQNDFYCECDCNTTVKNVNTNGTDGQVFSLH